MLPTAWLHLLAMCPLNGMIRVVMCTPSPILRMKAPHAVYINVATIPPHIKYTGTHTNPSSNRNTLFFHTCASTALAANVPSGNCCSLCEMYVCCLNLAVITSRQKRAVLLLVPV
jgi:hypothetical protein